MSTAPITNYHQPLKARIDEFEERARRLAAKARMHGLVVTIEQVNYEPRMGAHLDVIHVNPRRIGATSYFTPPEKPAVSVSVTREQVRDAALKVKRAHGVNFAMSIVHTHTGQYKLSEIPWSKLKDVHNELVRHIPKDTK